jgi:choline-sulfatase
LAAPWTASPPNILWLQVDSLDGRLLDPTSPYYDKLLLRGVKETMVAAGVSFVRHYTNSPQCVPSRTGMLTGRYCSEVGTTNNGQGLAASTQTGALDASCVALWGAAQCAAFKARQNVSETFLDLVRRAGMAVHMVGRVDAGGGILTDYPGTTGTGFHSGPDLHILARGADIAGSTDVEPWSATQANDHNPYAPDEAEDGALEAWLRSHDPASGRWFAWLGLLDPHPPYASNATWRAKVNASAVDAPPLPALRDMHPFDARQSLLKNVTLDYSPSQLREMRTVYWAAAAQALVGLEGVLAVARETGHLNNTVVM